MLRDATIGQFFPGDSYIHKMDPRAKLVFSFGAIIAIFVCKTFESLAVVTLAAILCVFVSKIPFKTIFKGLKAVIFVIIITAVIQLFYVKTGETLVEFWKIKITTGGLSNSIFICVRIIVLILYSSLLTYTTSPTSLTDGMERLFSPLKIIHVPVGTLAMMMTIALRFIPTLNDEIGKIMNAQKARGADLGNGSVINRAKALIPIFVPLFVNSFRRAYELAFAMECRCYHGGEGRTRLKIMTLSWRDYISFTVLAVLYAGIIILNHFFTHVI